MSQRPSNPNNLPDPEEPTKPGRNVPREEPPRAPNEDKPVKEPRRTEPGREAPTDIDTENQGEMRL